MWECLADRWARRCMKVNTNTALLESYFGAMLRDSMECSVEHRHDNGKEIFTFFFLDCSSLTVTLNRDAVCEDVEVGRRPR